MDELMKINICEFHSELLKQQIKDFGLSHLIKSVNELDVVKKVFNGTYDSIEDFDPFLMVSYGVVNNAIKTYGPSILKCPLCEHAHHNGDPEEWINEVAIQTYTEARRLGLAATIQ